MEETGSKKISTKKKRKKSPASQKSEPAPEPEISLDQWVTKKIGSHRKIRPEQRDELIVYIRSIGLSDKEKESRYEEAFKKF